MKTLNLYLRKLLLLPMLVMAMSYANAQDEKVFVTEGKTWICDLGEGGDYTAFVFKLSGDTIFNDKTYKKMYKNDVFQYGVRQEGQKVYWAFSGNHAEELVYDFGLKKGDTFVYKEFKSYVLDVDTINVEGIEYRRLKMYNIFENEEINEDTEHSHYWIEGIGVNTEPVCPLFGRTTQTPYRFVKCVYNDKCIFTLDDFFKKNTNGIDNLTKKDIGNAPVYDMSGRKLNAVPQRGLYIQGGKKRIVK